MTELLRTVSTLSILVFAVSSMLSAGFSFTFREIFAPFREPNRILRALAGHFVLVPLLALVIARAFSLDPPEALAFILLGTAAGASFLIKLVAIASADVALGTALLVLLVPMTVVFMAFVVPWLAPAAEVNAISIAIPLVLTMLLPLAIGLVVTESAPRWANRFQPIARTVSTITLVLLLVTTLLVHVGDLVDLLAGPVIYALLLFVLGSFAIGYLIASPHPERRTVLGLGTAQRNIAAATVVASGIPGRDTLVTVVVAALLGLLVLIPMARWLRGRSQKAASETQP